MALIAQNTQHLVAYLLHARELLEVNVDVYHHEGDLGRLQDMLRPLRRLKNVRNEIQVCVHGVSLGEVQWREKGSFKPGRDVMPLVNLVRVREE